MRLEGLELPELLERLVRLDREKRVEKLDSGRGFAEGLGRLEGGA